MWVFELIFSFLVGAYIGSYITTVLSRIKAKKKVRGGYSYCFRCEARLGLLHIIPVFSYINNKGRCPYCKEEIGKSSILWEVGMGLLFSTITYFLLDKLGYLAVVPVFVVAIVFHLVTGVDSGFKTKWR